MLPIINEHILIVTEKEQVRGGVISGWWRHQPRQTNENYFPKTKYWYFSLLLFAEKVTKSRRETNTSRFPVGSLMLLLHYGNFSNRKSISGIWFARLPKLLFNARVRQQIITRCLKV